MQQGEDSWCWNDVLLSWCFIKTSGCVMYALLNMVHYVLSHQGDTSFVEACF